jgi:signal peptidase I
MNIKSFLKELLITLLMAAVLFVIFLYVIQRSPVDGTSMVPSLENGQQIIVSRVTYLFHEPQRGDIITLHPPFASPKPFVKRVIGLPGETIEIKSGKVYVNGALLSEPYIKQSFTYTMPAVKVPEGQYFVLGDNRDISEDSHYFGTIPKKNIIGKAWLSIWPFDRFGLAPNYRFTQ